MRALIWEALASDPVLAAYIPRERWIQQGAVDEAPARPFAVVAFTDRPRSEVGSPQPRVTVWVHDNRGSYSRIDEIVAYLESNLLTKVPLEDDDHRIVDIRWEGSSGDLVDPGYDTNTRNAVFVLTGRK